MSRIEKFEGRAPDGHIDRFVLEVLHEDDHWTSVLSRLDEQGQPTAQGVAPRFYGLTEEQARRRSIAALENQYEDVTQIA